MSLEQKTRRALFAEIVDNMECLQRDVEGCVSWVARDVNTKHNLQWLDKNYSYLRVHFPIARIKRKPRKLASQLLHLFAKKCDFECERRTDVICCHHPRVQRSASKVQVHLCVLKLIN